MSCIYLMSRLFETITVDINSNVKILRLHYMNYCLNSQNCYGRDYAFVSSIVISDFQLIHNLIYVRRIFALTDYIFGANENSFTLCGYIFFDCGLAFSRKGGLKI